MYKNFLNCEVDQNQIDSFIKVFKDGETIGIASFEFHNDKEFRIYIDREDNESIMLTFETKIK